MSQVERNKQRVCELTEELDRIPEFYSDEFVSDYAPYAPPRHGHAGVRTMVEGAHKTFTPYREGKIVHQKGLVDNLHALRQLGVVPTPKSE